MRRWEGEGGAGAKDVCTGGVTDFGKVNGQRRGDGDDNDDDEDGGAGVPTARGDCGGGGNGGDGGYRRGGDGGCHRGATTPSVCTAGQPCAAAATTGVVAPPSGEQLPASSVASDRLGVLSPNAPPPPSPDGPPLASAAAPHLFASAAVATARLAAAAAYFYFWQIK